jgi:L-fucose mutarotase
MLIGISPLLTPDLLHALASMGHGDEIVLADANFPATTLGKRLIHLPGVSAPAALQAVLSVMPLDSFVEQPALTMQIVGDSQTQPAAVAEFDVLLQQHGYTATAALERQAFYQRAGQAFAVVATGELRTYGNIILKKGVIAA